MRAGLVRLKTNTTCSLREGGQWIKYKIFDRENYIFRDKCSTKVLHILNIPNLVRMQDDIHSKQTKHTFFR